MFYVDKKDDKGNITQGTTTKWGDATKHLCGTSLPSTYGGFGTTFNFKGFDVAANFTYQLGGKVYDTSYANSMSFDRGAVFHKDLLNAWTPENKNSDIPRIQYDDTYMGAQSDRFLTSASYLAFQDFTVGYTLPTAWVKAASLTKVRLYVQGNNLYLGSKRKGLDPRQSLSGAISASYYAPIRTISGGITVSF